MKIAIIDISGKVPYYDHALCSELHRQRGNEIVLITPYSQEKYNPIYNVKHLCRFPEIADGKLRKIFKAFEGIFNYILLIPYILLNNINVIHLQWLPFLEYIEIEKYFLSLYRIISPKTKFVLTQHNIYPHNCSDSNKQKYNKRMRNVKDRFTHFILHTESSKKIFCEEFNVNSDTVSVIYHGVFVPNTIPQKKSSISPKRLLMFGLQSTYKGTDLLVDAVALLPERIKRQVHVIIAGGTDEKLLVNKLPLAKELGITWLPKYIDDDELNQLIADSDILILPYRAITQSGVLLQSLPYKKHLIVSDLPSFRETLQGYPEECFVEPGSVESLAKGIIMYIDGKCNMHKEMIANDLLLNKYSWEQSAHETFIIYKLISSKNYEQQL